MPREGEVGAFILLCLVEEPGLFKHQVVVFVLRLYATFVLFTLLPSTTKSYNQYMFGFLP